MEKLSLYEIEKSLQKVQDVVDDPEELSIYLDGIKMQEQEKVENIVRYQRMLELQSDTIASEIKRLSELKAVYDKRNANIKNYLQRIMEIFGVKEYKTTIARVFFRKSTSVKVEGEVPNDYMQEKLVKLVDKLKIGKDLKAGKKLSFAKLEEKNNLQIK